MIAIIPERVIGMPRNTDRHRPESPNHRPRPYQGLLWCYMHSNYRVWVVHSALDRMLGHVLPIKFADVVERKALLGNESRIKKRCHKNVMPRLHFRVAGSFQVAADDGF